MTGDRARVWWTRGAAAALAIGLIGIAALVAGGAPDDARAALSSSAGPEAHADVGPVSETFASRLESLKRRVEAAPDDAAARLALARFLHDAHRLPEAVEHYEAAVALDPSGSARFDLAQAWTQLGEWDRAAESMRAVLLEDPGNAAALYNLGAIEATRGDAEAAIGFWRRVVETGHPEFAPRARQSIGRLEDARNRP